MDKHFFDKIYQRQQGMEAVPSNQRIALWAETLLELLYPEKAELKLNSAEAVEAAFTLKRQELVAILEATQACEHCNNTERATIFFDQLPALYDILNTDVDALLEGDPAAHSEFEVIRAYPGVFAIAFYRIAHMLSKLDIPLLPRILTEHAHSRTGIDIHPGAQIGTHFFIDHGTGVVIGETCRIGNHVKLYQGVTLGALSVTKSMAFQKRHPTVEDHVIIYSGATVLGGETTVGHHSIIGGNVWLTRSVEPYSTVYHKPQVEVIAKSKI